MSTPSFEPQRSNLAHPEALHREASWNVDTLKELLTEDAVRHTGGTGSLSGDKRAGTTS